MVLQIALGIVLAVIITALLPAMIAGALWVVGMGLVLAVALCTVWLLFEGAMTADGFAYELIIAGVFLVWLHYEIKARREMAAEASSAEDQ